MAPFDEIWKKNAQDEALKFAGKIFDAKDTIVSFVDNRLGWEGSAQYDTLLAGSFNISLKVQRGGSNQYAIIRFPFQGKSFEPWGEEKVTNEAMTMEYIRKHTQIPIPTVHYWGNTEQSPGKLGPFLIMDFVEGENLGRFLAAPTDDKSAPIVLNPEIDAYILDGIYEQIAQFILELSRLEFPRIGAIAPDHSSGKWNVVGRPLTYDMNEVVTAGGCSPTEVTLNKSFDSAQDFFQACTEFFQKHLEVQRNISGDDDVAWKQFVARQCLAKLVPKFTIDHSGPFRLFCDDFRPSNMLIDPKTHRIVAVFDFEFTNAMPAQFIED
ncbi:Protein kinase-like domain protein, partial [Fusarium austroafricanum]